MVNDVTTRTGLQAEATEVDVAYEKDVSGDEELVKKGKMIGSTIWSLGKASFTDKMYRYITYASKLDEKFKSKIIEREDVLVILDNLIKEDYNKIPKEYIEFLTANCNNDYEFYYDTSKTFEQQELLDDTKYILFGVFEKFGSTELQKEKIKAF